MSSESTKTRQSFFTGAVVAVVGTLASVYMISQFLRNSVGVIAPDLARELDLSASEIGLLSSAFFIAFAGAQIPLGMALDRFGPRICMIFCAAVVVVAAIVFAMATSLFWLVVGRVLLGLGSSCYLMAPLALYARRYPADRFGMLTGIQIGLGSIGALIATAPLAYSAAAIGWRLTFLVVGAVMFAATIVMMVVVREDEPGNTPPSAGKKAGQRFGGLLDVVRTDSVWRLFMMHLTAYSSFTLVVGLWGGPYLAHVYGYDLRSRGDLLFVAAVMQVIAALLWGPLDRTFRSYKIPVLVGAGGTALSLALIAVLGTVNATVLVFWFAMVGLFSAFTPVLIAHGKALFTPDLVGRGMTILNMATMGGVFVTQALTGAVMDLFPSEGGVYPVAAYQTVFGLQAVAIVLMSLIYFGSRDPWGTPYRQG